MPQTYRIVLPDGSILLTEIWDSDYDPTVQIFLQRSSEIKELVCFVEYNPERCSGQELCIGAYCSSTEDTVYYDSFVQ